MVLRTLSVRLDRCGRGKHLVGDIRVAEMVAKLLRQRERLRICRLNRLNRPRKHRSMSGCQASPSQMHSRKAAG